MKQYKKPWVATEWHTDLKGKGKMKRLWQKISRAKLKKRLEKTLKALGLK